jgi:Tfp pilus assembly protein PilF
MRKPIPARCAVVLCALALLCVRVSAESEPRWFQVQTEHFTVITDGSEKQGLHIAGQLERMQAVFTRLIPTAHSDTGSPIVVLALKNKRDFQSLEPAAYLAKNQLDLAGLFLQTPDKSYILLRLDATGGEHPFSVVYHEYTHYILRHATFIPLWLNEGLAEFYQNTDIDEKQVRFGQPSRDDILFLRQNNLIPLPILLNVDHNSPYYHDEQKGSMFYPEAWALTHFVIINDRLNHTDRLTQYLNAVSVSHDPVAAAQQAFGDLKKLQQSLDTYINHGEYREFLMPTGVSVDEAAFHVDPLSTPDADSIRANVLVANDRTQEAETLIDSVLQSNPDNALAHESKAILALREHDPATARKWYGEAVALHSTSYLAYYNFAVLSMELGSGSEASIEDSLQQSLKLNPNFAAANDALARFYGIHHKNLDDAIHLSVTAVSIEPDNLNYRLNNAQLHVERHELPSALSVLDAAKPYAKSPGELAEIAMRREQIWEYQTALAHQASTASQSAASSTIPSGTTTVSTTVALHNSADSGGATTTASSPSAAADDNPHYPDAPPTGPRHVIRGILHDVHCTYPTILTLAIEGSNKTLSLYTNNMYKVQYGAANFTPAKALQPCTEFEGLRATVTYTDVADKRVDGQIVSISVSK